MITELTKEQEAKLPEYRERWLQIGLSCEPCDFEKAKAAAIRVYELAGCTPPKDFYLADSPYSAAKLACQLRQHYEKGKTLEEAYKYTPSADEIKRELQGQIYGSHDANWLGFYEFFRDECNIEECHKLDGLIELAQHCGWWSAYDVCAILQHRHLELHRDEENRLHNEDGMAVRYRDGWGVWAIHGVRVDEQIIMRPDTQTIDQMKNEENEEIKRIRIERYGWHNYLKGINAKTLDQRFNEVEQVKEVLMEGDGMRVLICACPSTAKVFPLEVSTDCDTCEEAQRYLQGGIQMNIIGAT